jgi:hypothetical protein
MQQLLMRHRSSNTAWVGFNYTGEGTSAVQFSFAFQLHPSTFSKELSQIFTPIPGGGHPTLRTAAVTPLLLLRLEEAHATGCQSLVGMTALMGNTVILMAR